MKPADQLVANQYEQWSYPEPIRDIEEHYRSGMALMGDPSLFSSLFWPEGRPRRELRILVAGCGTSQAAVAAFRNRDCSVVGVDQSAASLAHTRYLQERHALTNLTLFQGDLHDIEKIGGAFDFIICTGVLHHLDSPLAGLRALKAGAHENTAFYLMLYGAIGRHAVYLLQDAFRAMGVTQGPDDVAFTKQALGELPKSHPAHQYIATAFDLKTDPGIVDTFLHSRDRAFTVSDIVKLAADADLHFQSWTDNSLYYPDAFLASTTGLYQRLIRLPDEAQWIATEKLASMPKMHTFLLSSRKVAQVDFVSPEWIDWKPRHHPFFQKVEKGFKRQHITMQLDDFGAHLLGRSDGKASIRDIVPESHRDRAKAFYASMHRMGNVFFAKA